MNGNRILVTLGLAALCATAGAAEPATPPAVLPIPLQPAEDAPAEHWQYHEKWDKAQQRGLVPAPKSLAPATECRPSAGMDRGPLRPAPLPGRCAEHGVRLRT